MDQVRQYTDGKDWFYHSVHFHNSKVGERHKMSYFGWAEVVETKPNDKSGTDSRQWVPGSVTFRRLRWYQGWGLRIQRWWRNGKGPRIGIWWQ